MSLFCKIMVAVDISKEAELVISKAKELADQFSAELLLVHVVEPVVMDSTYDLVPAINTDIEESLVDRSKHFLAALVKKYDLPNKEPQIAVGSTKAEIHRAARENAIDLIVVGTHCRHGVARLLGSTANAILHGAPCDIYCVKIPE